MSAALYFRTLTFETCFPFHCFLFTHAIFTIFFIQHIMMVVVKP